MRIKTFDKYYKNYESELYGPKLTKILLRDAKNIYTTLAKNATGPVSDEIQKYYKLDYDEQNRLVPGLDKGHTNISWYGVCSIAYGYAIYVEKSNATNEYAARMAQTKTINVQRQNSR